MIPALRLEEVHKSYGAVRALDGLSLEVPRGVICGLVGPNGAGKTTAFGVIGGLVRPDAGHVDLLGEGAFDVVRHRGRVALLPQDAALSPHTPVRGLLVHYARLQGMTHGAASREADTLLDEVGLSDKARARIRELSHGMRRRVAVAQALLGTPELVLLDEPTSGLDPELVVRMRALFRGRRGHSTLLISSHMLAELESTCDHVVFMERGRCIQQGALAAVTGQRSRVLYRWEDSPDPPLPLTELPLQARASITEDGLQVDVPEGVSPARLNAALLPWLIDRGVGIVEVRSGQGLEAAWLDRRRSTESTPH